jgi:hypothetical protein
VGERALEQLAGLLRAALTGAQLAQPGAAATGERRARRRQVADGGDQLLLGRAPLAARDEHVPVRGAAHADRWAAAQALPHDPHGAAPLRRPREVADALACGDEDARHPGRRDGQLEVLDARQRASAVQTPHPLGQAPPPDEDQPLGGEPQGLEVRHGQLAADRRRVAGARRRLGRVSGHLEGEHRLHDGQPAVLGAARLVAEEVARALQPAGGDGVVATEVQRVGRQPGGLTGCAAAVAGRPERAVRALARGEGRLLVVAPPAGPGQPLPGAGIAAGLGDRGVTTARLAPSAPLERVAGGCERVVDR